MIYIAVCQSCGATGSLNVSNNGKFLPGGEHAPGCPWRGKCIGQEDDPMMKAIVAAVEPFLK